MRLAGVLGWPVAQSLSPRLHGFWLREHRVAGAYLPFAVPPEGLDAALDGLRALGAAGCNLTIPHKEAGFAWAMQRGVEMTPLARRVQAVNTLVFGVRENEVQEPAAPGGSARVEPSQTILAHNTDVEGFLRALAEAAPDLSLQGRVAAVIGAGGAARAVLAALDAAGVARVILYNRSLERAEALAPLLESGSRLEVRSLAPALRVPEEAALLVNTTSLGMSGEPPLDLDLAPLPAEAVVADIVYKPLRTPLLRAAEARGLRVMNGLEMLMHQAVPGFRAWFGVEPQVTPALRAELLAALEPG